MPLSTIHPLLSRPCARLAARLRRLADRISPPDPSPTIRATLASCAGAVAALVPLPKAPPVTNDAALDAANLVIYQQALADHAQRVERIRAFGSVAAMTLAK